MTSKNVRILIVEDSGVYATTLKQVVAKLNYAELIDVASNGKIGLEKITLHKPDLVFSDLEMPVMNGIEMIKSIQRKWKDLPVIIISSHDKRSSTLGVEALALGALDFVQKPTSATLSIDEIVRQFVKTLQPYVNLIKTKKTANKYNTSKTKPIEPTQATQTGTFSAIQSSNKTIPSNLQLIVIGISTGGPNTLSEIIPKIALPYKVPILIVQHIPPFFAESLANRLNKLTDLNVKIAIDGDSAKAGDIVLAPGGKHMILESTVLGGIKLKVVDFPPVHGCKPAVDVLLQSVLQAGLTRTVTFIMTGMGKDGCAGVTKLRSAGSYSIIQDEESSTVWGMPGAVYEAKQYDKILSKRDIATTLNQLGK
ncbi:MAG: chemotaxis-specific protein-glutamate methyltransferase CheB [Candidatus Cloacimonetes bacterium]|nr:chemotaxis-specific protein-glutamate methyltransferase CheB [Candidatus Cloacimonadota bacterium]